MPSETMNFPGFFADDASLPREISGFWKSNNLPNYYGGTGKAVARSPVENIGALECQPAKSLELYQSLMQDQKVNESFGRDAVGTNKAFMLRPDVLESGIRSNLNVQQKHHYAQSGRVDNLSTQNKNSLFSHSLSELVSRKLRSSSNNVPYDQSVDTFASHVVEEEPLEPLEEIEAQTIGNLLPTDDDLFNEMTDKMNNIQQQLSGKDDIEELDVFSSLGGLDLGNDGFAAQNNNEFTVGVSNGKSRYRNRSLAGGNPFSAYPSRTIFARNINSNIEDSELRALFEKYGDIQAFYTSFKHRGFVMISYYDIRSATNAKQALQNVQLRHHKLDIHYSNPKDNSDEDINQGAVVILNLDSSISIDELRQIFCAFGDVKEIRETSPRSQHKFIEFYDLRAAGAAFRALNGSNIEGKQINLELNRAGGSRCLFQRFASDFEQDECHSYAPQSIRRSFSTNGFPGTAPHGGIISSSMDDGIISGFASAKQSAFMESAFGHGISSSVPNSMSSRLRADSSTNQTGFGERGQQLKYDIQGTPNSHPHSLPDNYDDLKNTIQSMGLMPSERTNNRKLHKVRSNGHLIEFDDGVYGSAVNGSCSLSGHHYGWGNSHNPHSPGVMWSNSPTFTLASPTERVHGSSPVFSSALPVKNQQQHMGSAPSGNGSLWERRRAYAGKSSSDGAGGGFHSGSLGSLRVSDTTTGGGSLELVSPNMLPNYMELSVPPKGAGFQPHHQRSPMRSPLRSPMRSPIFPGRGQMSPISNSFESPNERSRSRRNEGSINPADKKQYELDLDRILQGDDKRTTLMIKNIPNKYTSKMLLAAIDEHHRGTYDFIYLPIDFKNKCNVGYAFINMIDPCQIVPFYKAFNGKKWEKFNSEKIASIAYARIQGKAALVAHFQNSSLMNEDKRCRPILFNTDGPNAGDQVPFPTGINVRTRPAKTKTPSSQEDNQLTSSEEFSNGDTSSGSGRDSD